MASTAPAVTEGAGSVILGLSLVPQNCNGQFPMLTPSLFRQVSKVQCDLRKCDQTELGMVVNGFKLRT